MSDVSFVDAMGISKEFHKIFTVFFGGVEGGNVTTVQPHIHLLDNIILSEPSRYTLTDRRGAERYLPVSKEASRSKKMVNGRSNDARSTINRKNTSRNSQL
jgi:hypothetical protein